jgi:hypothetical protein
MLRAVRSLSRATVSGRATNGHHSCLANEGSTNAKAAGEFVLQRSHGLLRVCRVPAAPEIADHVWSCHRLGSAVI